MKRLGKNTAWTIGILSMLLLAAACSNDNNAKNTNATPSAESSPTASASSSPESSPSSSPSAPASPSASHEATKLEGSGVYNGQVDSHSIEVEVGGQATVFQIGSDISEQVADWDEGVQVKFEYTEANVDSGGQTLKQFTIVAIEKQ